MRKPCCGRRCCNISRNFGWRTVEGRNTKDKPKMKIVGADAFAAAPLDALMASSRAWPMAPNDRDFERASQPQGLQLPGPVRCVAEKMPTAETRWGGVLVMRVSIWIVVARSWLSLDTCNRLGASKIDDPTASMCHR